MQKNQIVISLAIIVADEILKPHALYLTSANNNRGPHENDSVK